MSRYSFRSSLEQTTYGFEQTTYGFFWAAGQSGARHTLIGGWFPMICWRDSQGTGLLQDNLFNGGNDRQARNLEDALGRIGQPPKNMEGQYEISTRP